MAIDTGIGVDCTALQSTGGIKQICLRSFAADDVVTYSNAAGKHDVTSITSGGGSTANWFVFEFKNETAALTINATKENGSTAFECGVNFMIPQINNSRMHEKERVTNDNEDEMLRRALLFVHCKPCRRECFGRCRKWSHSRP